MPRPTPPVKRVCYGDDITVWASGPNIPLLESMINSLMRDVDIYQKENSLLISDPKSTVTLFTPDTHQFQTHPDITLEDTQLPLERSPKILRVIITDQGRHNLHKHKHTQGHQHTQHRTTTYQNTHRQDQRHHSSKHILSTKRHDVTTLQHRGQRHRILHTTRHQHTRHNTHR